MGQDVTGFWLGPGEGREILNPEGRPVLIKLGGAETGGAYSLLEATVAPGEGPNPHVHEQMDEAWYILSGEMTFRIGDREVIATRGSCVFGPRGIPHAFTVSSATPAVCLVLASPPMDQAWEALTALQRGTPGGPQGVRALDPAVVEAVKQQFRYQSRPVRSPFPWREGWT